METFDYDVVDKIYEPYDNLGLSVILHGDGTREYKVLGALAEAVKAQSSNPEQWNRLKEIFTAKSLQLVSFTITEKGYALQKADGSWFPFVEADIKNGPDKATGAMAVLVARRPDYLRQACERILKYRSPQTICGLAKRIGREGEETEILTLKELMEAEADMFTTVYIGNSSTKQIGGHMVTPRGYERKYFSGKDA